MPNKHILDLWEFSKKLNVEHGSPSNIETTGAMMSRIMERLRFQVDRDFAENFVKLARRHTY